jgi:hypothetical protein
MNDKAFREALSECLERIRLGDSVEACLEAHPQYAAQLASFLSAASRMKKIVPPQPSAAAMNNARNRLLGLVAEGGGKEAVMKGVFKFSHAMMAVGAVFLLSLGLVGAAGSGMLGGGSNSVTFDARVVSTSQTLFYVQREDDQSFVFLNVNGQTQFEDPNGVAVLWSAVSLKSRVNVEATPAATARFFDAQVIRQVPATPSPTFAATPFPTAEPTAEPATTPQPAAEPTPKPKPVVTPKVTPKPEPVKTPHEEPVKTPGPQATEFYGTVAEMGSAHIVVETDSGHVWVGTNHETQYPNGAPFVGVMVYVYGYKNADGSVTAVKVALKGTEFGGKVTAISGSDLQVLVDGGVNVVHTNGSTQFPAGQPQVNDEVYVWAWKMGDGTFMAFKVKVKAPPAATFSGTIVGYFPDEKTICVKVAGHSGSQDAPCIGFGSDVKTVCYEFADVIGELAVGKTVDVYKDHIEGNTYFAWKIVVK